MDDRVTEKQYSDVINDLKKERLFLDVLCREYTSVFCLDFREKTLEILKLDPVANICEIVDNEFRKKIDYDSLLSEYANNYVVEEFRDNFIRIMSLTSLLERKEESDCFSYRYMSKPNKASQTCFMTELRTIDKRYPELALLAFRNIDDLVKDENERIERTIEKNLLEERVTELNENYTQTKYREAILNALCSDYEVVYFCDLEADTLQVVKDSNPRAPVGTICKFSEVASIFKKMNNLIETAADYVQKLEPSYLISYLQDHDEMSMQFCVKKDSGMTYMETRIIRVATNSGFKVILGSRHIDEIVREHEERNRRLNEAASEAQRANASKTEFLRRMSHDIRTPLNGICGMVEIAEHYDDNLDRQLECRKKVKESAQLLLELVNEVLDMNKLESGNITLENTTFNLLETAEEVFAVVAKLAEERRINVVCNGKDISHYNVLGSPVHVKRIMMNIMSNAVKYNKDCGTIEITGEEIPSDIEGTALFRFTCHDTGIGMSEEFQKHLFEPFAQESLDENIRYSRTGLGLSITKKLVDAMNGTLEFSSQKGVGSTFIVTLPLQIATEAPAQYEKDTINGDLTGMNILLVEDNELNMEISEFMLINNGAFVTRAWNGQEAVREFENSEPGRFDIILMDIMMPQMDGYAATEYIRSLSRPDAKIIPIIAMSANAFTDDKIKAKMSGMNAHISKPVSEEKLVSLIKEIGKN